MNRLSVTLFSFSLAMVSFTRSGLYAQAAPPANHFKITLEKSEEDGESLLLATVTDQGKPVEGVSVSFWVKRLFGNLKLGEEETLDDGTSAVPFPSDVPGDKTGQLTILVQIAGPENEVGHEQIFSIQGGKPKPVQTTSFPRELWTRHAPVSMLVTIVSLLGIVWATYAYAIYQLVKIKKGEC